MCPPRWGDMRTLIREDRARYTQEVRERFTGTPLWLSKAVPSADIPYNIPVLGGLGKLQPPPKPPRRVLMPNQSLADFAACLRRW
jgi:hypothetical protein